MGGIELKDLLRQSGVQNEHPEQIELIDIDKLVSDERNFYKLTGIDELAENIELVGLMDPLRVRGIKSSDGHCRIVSGHRRRAALKKLVDAGKDSFRQVPCIIERDECSNTMEEIRLIWANKDTRDLTSPELLLQAERAEKLLLKYREEGGELPGKMRSHVAQVCNVNESKLARLKVIHEQLHPSLLPDWESGELNDSVAYRIAQEDRRVQDRLFADNGHAPRHWTAERTNQVIADIKAPKPTLAAPKASPDSKGYSARQRADDYLAQRADEDVTFTRFIQKHGFAYFLKHAAGITRKHGIDEMKNRVGFIHVNHCGYEGDRWDAMPNGLTLKDLGQSFRRSWTEVWDAMAVEALRRCRLEQINAENPKKPEPEGQLVLSGWMPGGTTPFAPTDAVVIFNLGGRRIRRLCRWTGSDWTFEQGGAKIELDPIKWMALPPDEEDEA